MPPRLQTMISILREIFFPPVILRSAAGLERQSSLPADLLIVLAKIGDRLERGQSIAGELPEAIAGISTLPAATISQAAPTIAAVASRYGWRLPSPLWDKIPRRRLTDREQLLNLPDSKYLFIFHEDGRLREAALQRIDGPLTSPFIFAAVAWRLNDWVEQVRTAASACAERCFSLSPAKVVAEAAAALLPRQDSWQRWGPERAPLHAAFAREDVNAELADLLIEMTAGPAPHIFRFVLRHEAIDAHLERIATHARQPQVRAVALGCLADARASWPVGWEWKWIDKSMGRRLRVRKFETRDIKRPPVDSDFLGIAASDKSAVVRRAALDALIRRFPASDKARQVALGLQHDRSAPVRTRANFILAHPTAIAEQD